MDSTNRVDIPKTYTEPLASILNNLRLERIQPGLYRGDNLVQVTGRVYGGQVFGQATVAAADHVKRTLDIDDDERLCHSMTAAFLRPGRLDAPLLFHVEQTNDGHSFSTRTVHAIQDDNVIFSARISFQLRQPSVSLGLTQPEVTGPDNLRSSVDYFASMDHWWAKNMSSTNAIDMRRVEGDIYAKPDPVRRPHQYLWLKSRSAMPEGTSRTVQRAVLGYSADQFMLEPAMRAMGLHWMSRNISVATLDHEIWWHRNFDMSDWILADMTCLSAQNGRALCTASFFQNDKHIATMNQEGMVRFKHLSSSVPTE